MMPIVERKMESGKEKEGKHAKILLHTVVARCKFSNAARKRSLQRDRTKARFSEHLPIGPPWRLRGWVSLILVGAPEDKQSSVLCYWRGAEPAEAFMKALCFLTLIHPRLTLSHHVAFTISRSHPHSRFLSHIHTSQVFLLFLSLFFVLACKPLLFRFFLPLWHPLMIVQSRILTEREREKPLYNLGHNSRKFFFFEGFTRSHRLVRRLLTTSVIHRMQQYIEHLSTNRSFCRQGAMNKTGHYAALVTKGSIVFHVFSALCIYKFRRKSGFLSIVAIIDRAF